MNEAALVECPAHRVQYRLDPATSTHATRDAMQEELGAAVNGSR